MFCKYCGGEIDDDAKFCPKCGARLARQESNVAVDKAARGAAEANEATTETEAVSLAGETAETASVETAASEAETAAKIAEATETTEKAEATDALPAQSDAESSEASEDAATGDAATDAASGAGDSVNVEADAGANTQPGDGATAEAVKDEDSALTSGGAGDVIGASGATETSSTAASDDKQWDISPQSCKTALLLAIFGGVLGLHRFYLGKGLGIFETFIMWAIGIVIALAEDSFYAGFFVLAILALWAIIDVILLATGHYTDGYGRGVLLSLAKCLTARAIEDGSGVEIYAFDVPPQNRCGITVLNIPSRIGGVPVVGIADGAFKDCTDLISVKIPRTVTRIGKGAFDGCSNLSLKSQAAIKAMQKSSNISPKVVTKPLRKKRWIKIGVIAAASAAAMAAVVIGVWGVLHKYDVMDTDDGFSLKRCHIAAVLGDSEAQFNLAYYYNSSHQTGDYFDRDFHHIDPDYIEAAKWYKKVAAKGDVVAQNNLGILYERGGYGISQDYNEAAMWYRKAAEHDNDRAAYNLAHLYEQGGYGLSRDYRAAAIWYRKIAEQNDAAAYNLARLYARGLGVGKDYDKALEYAKKAYDLGHPSAKAAIRLLTRGKGW